MANIFCATWDFLITTVRGSKSNNMQSTFFQFRRGLIYFANFYYSTQRLKAHAHTDFFHVKRDKNFEMYYWTVLKIKKWYRDFRKKKPLLWIVISNGAKLIIIFIACGFIEDERTRTSIVHEWYSIYKLKLAWNVSTLCW